jgi:hypothetical protein
MLSRAALCLLGDVHGDTKPRFLFLLRGIMSPGWRRDVRRRLKLAGFAAPRAGGLAARSERHRQQGSALLRQPSRVSTT